ncbi:MAG: rRNA adenine N(6)-methyltransferase family protein [Actinomycetota bacterium]|nr:rRNA adenine N(6)-methyltransferase family protein [Actinomycetota bacterium]
MSSRSLGWHELSPRWAQLLVDEAHVPSGSWVLDIGAGTGALTGPLLDAGARVIAVEAHPDRARHLRRRFGGAIIVVEADAGDLRLPRRPFSVVANPPFAVTSPLLRRLVQPGSRLMRADLVTQEQAARRWASRGAPGAGRWQREFAAELGRPIPRTALRPPPRVSSRVLRLERRVLQPRGRVR